MYLITSKNMKYAYIFVKKRITNKMKYTVQSLTEIEKINSSYCNYLKNENNNNTQSHDTIIAQV